MTDSRPAADARLLFFHPDVVLSGIPFSTMSAAGGRPSGSFA